MVTRNSRGSGKNIRRKVETVVVVVFSLTAICTTSNSSSFSCSSKGSCPGDLGSLLGGLMMADMAVATVL